MGKEELIVCFQDTLEMSKTGVLGQKTSQAIKSNIVYKEGFISNTPKRSEQSSVIVQAGTTSDTARQYRFLGKVAVLNFANPENPGGGVNFGAMAQEECLCRSSNLYLCISDRNVFDDYYLFHRGIKNQFFSDRLIYTKDVTVFKNDNEVPQLLPKDEWFSIDVITCAAPCLARRKYTNTTALLSVFKRRIKNIFEAARDNKVDVIILGAFGCGAFKNPPLIVAEAFRQVICEENYFADFKQIIFAIKPTSADCPNLNTFARQFDSYAPDAMERCVLISEPAEWRFSRIPDLPNEIIRSKNQEFRVWQLENKYFGKQFSVLGDSISTLDGYNPKGYKVFYGGDKYEKSGVKEMNNTWWDKVISFFGGELLVNNSWSGSRVTKLSEKDQLFPSGCSDERTSSLHINDVNPDVILVYLGTNDWAFGAKTGDIDCSILGEDDNEIFALAYEAMLTKIKFNYPQSEIWCCTLCETYMSKHPDFSFPHEYAGIHIEDYNEIIRNVVSRNKCKLIDLYSYKMPYDSIDGTHPNNSGMNTIATMITREMAGKEANRFLDCADGCHEYVMTEQYTGGTKYVCNRCGKVKHESIMKDIISEDKPDVNVKSEYVMLDPNITTILYSDTLRLTIESSCKTIEFQKTEVIVGRHPSCDLNLSGKNYVARHQATFFYEHEMWFLRDNFSTNGTWINGVRIQPGKKYQLATNDEINFAMSEKMIFYKHEQNAQAMGDPDAKAIAFLEAGMETFVKSKHTDEVSLKLIVASLSNVPLYFPVEIDLEAMLDSVDPTKLKPGDTLQPQKDVKMRILTMSPKDGVEFVPMFTSNTEANKGPSTSIVRYYPQDYLPMLIQMDKPVIINPFSDSRFLLSKHMITEILLPLVQSKTNPPSVVTQQDEQMDKYIGTVVGEKYSVLKLLGRGGFYTTYLVRDQKSDKTWAMKACDKMNRSYSPVIRENILQEPHMMIKLNHPAIPKVVDIVEDEENIFIIREYVEGVSLESVVRDLGAQPADKVVEWGKQLCDMLHYLHRLTPPHIYRDMKPANVILAQDGTLKVIDFGIVRMYDFMKDRDTCCLGTKGYAAPEQYGGSRQSDARTDIFGLGMTMHHLATGVDPKQPPYETKPICQVNPNLPKGLEYIITKCTQFNPDERYQNCDELIDDLNNYMNLPKPKGLFSKIFGKR